MIKLNIKETIAFLEWWGGDQSVLTAIPVVKKATDTDSFQEPKQVQGWVESHECDNIYFTVNPVMRPMSKKPARTDIRELAWLHVDIDPRPGHTDLKAEQDWALGQLTTKLPQGVPPPSCIIFSGGGYQGFWRLKEPFEISGVEAKYEEAKRWNMQLEILFNGDNCHNVDRIMRLPGTVNWPTARKQAKGRVPTEARVHEMNDLAYDLSEFTPAPEVTGGTQGFTANTVKVSGNVQKLSNVDDLGDQVSDRCKMVIVQGHDPDDPGKWASRSECLFWVCCDLVRAGVEDDVIFSVLMDSDFRISDSVIEKGSNAGKYAVRQIERAREEAIDPWLRRLNEEHAVVRVGSQVRILTSKKEQPGISYMVERDFLLYYGNKYTEIAIDDKTKEVPVGKWWLMHPNRRTYDRVVFSPERDVPGAYNLWEGFAYEARPGNCQMILDHAREIICDGDTKAFDYLMGWMATAVQHPAQPGQAAVVMRGRQGTGKGVFANAFGALFGRHYLYVSNSNHLFGQFNGHLEDCLVLFADEAFWAGNKKHEGMLKSLITESTIISERKNKDAVLGQNYIKLLMASNEDWVVPASHDDRRFLVLDVSVDRTQDTAYFGRLQDQLDSGGYEALLHHLMTFDISEFNIRKVPGTSALREQMVRSFSPEAEWWYGKLVDGRLLTEDDGWENTPFKDDVILDYSNHAKLCGPYTRGTSIKLGRFMTTVVPEGHILHGRVNIPRKFVRDGITKVTYKPYIYRLPTLQACRDLFDEKFGGPYDWPKDPELLVKESREQEAFE